VDREPLIALLLACKDPEPYEGAFDLPTAAAVLPVEMGPFTEPIGYVANGIGGLINNLALKQGNFLVQDPTASYLDGHALPTGRARSLSSVAAWGDGTSTWVFAGDRRFGQILAIPHIVDVVDGVPVEWVDAHEDAMLSSGPTFVDADGSGGPAPVFADLELKPGWTSTETWTLTYDGQVWNAEGSRSGPQEHPARPPRFWSADRRALNGRIIGDATPGDRIEIGTSNGIVEIDAGGVPTSMLTLPDGSAVAVVVDDLALGHPVLHWLDPVTLLLSPSSLPVYASPTRPAVSEDGLSLYVGDAAAPAIWRIPLDGSDAVALPVPWPVGDVAQLDGIDGIRRLFVAPIGSGEVWALDLDDNALIDLDAQREGIQGRDFGSVVAGIDAVPLAYPYPLANDDGERPIARSVAVATYAGRVLFLEELTGCLVSDELGPRTALVNSLTGAPDTQTNFDDLESGPYLEPDLASGRSAIVNACGGTARGEVWTLTFDRVAQVWEADGSFSGPQVGVAREDERYVSDLGQVSFTIRAGATPTRDGAQISFTVLEGVLSVTGDNDGDGLREVNFDNPGDPVYFHYFAGKGEGTDRPMVLSVHQGGDTVGRVDPQDGIVEASWR
jgi:hypothetical protein